MYRTHFGLREPPFGLTPDTAFVFACTPHQEALNVLLVAVESGEGFIKIVGEVGHGKTLLCRRFLATLGQNYVTAYLPNPLLDPRGLLLTLADELRVAVDREADQHHLIRSLNHALLDFARAGRKVVVCIDEAQALAPETLETLRLLSNLETEKRKLIHVVLFGQPELDAKLAQSEARQLSQRIAFHYKLGALSKKETEFYVAHRLRVAGYVGDRLFTAGALDALYRASAGVPRLINVLAHKAMLSSYGEGKHYVSARHVRRSAADTPAARRPWPRALLAGAVALVAFATAMAWYLRS
ncbi:MAG TPA: AAA family ATPase [Burkholderiales bacterium]|nr:AAA family ATPase [Burkholderiales bacterium]